MKIKRLKRPFVLLLAFVLLLSSISQSVSAADTGQVVNYPSLPILRGNHSMHLENTSFNELLSGWFG